MDLPGKGKLNRFCGWSGDSWGMGTGRIRWEGRDREKIQGLNQSSSDARQVSQWWDWDSNTATKPMTHKVSCHQYTLEQWWPRACEGGLQMVVLTLCPHLYIELMPDTAKAVGIKKLDGSETQDRTKHDRSKKVNESIPDDILLLL